LRNTAQDRLTNAPTSAILGQIKKITKGDVSCVPLFSTAKLPELDSRLTSLTQQWKCLIVDENSKKIIDNVVKEDDILNNNIASWST
jgi:hypothetical protein